MTLNDVISVILRYFAKFGTFGGKLPQIGWRLSVTTI